MASMLLNQRPEGLTEAVREAQQEPVVIQESGEAVAVVLSIEEYQRLTGEAEEPGLARGRWNEELARIERLPAELTLTEELWDRLTTCPYVEVSAESLAVPPGWRSARR